MCPGLVERRPCGLRPHPPVESAAAGSEMSHAETGRVEPVRCGPTPYEVPGHMNYRGILLRAGQPKGEGRVIRFGRQLLDFGWHQV